MEPNDSSQHQRAHRIADEIWELWREELVRLYIEGAELKEIPKVMAEEHQFFITTAQLKDQFRKWQVKKNFSKQELAWMASEKIKRGALGKRARFQHHGHEVEEERLERALKRHRSQMDTPEFPPISLKLVQTPPRSPQLAQVAPETQTSPISAPQFGDRTNTHPTMPSPYDSHLETASIVPRLDHASLEDNVGNDMRAGRDAMGSTPHSEWFALEPLVSLPKGSNYQIPLAALNEIEQILRSPLAEGGNLMLSRAGSAQSPDSDWRRFFNLSPTTRSRSRTFGSLVSSPRQSQPGDPPSHQLFAPFSGARSSSILSVRSSEINMRSNVHDPESILLNLQLMKSSLVKVLGFVLDTRASRGFKIRKLKGHWLQHQLEDLIYEACTSTAATIHRQRLAREGAPSPAVLDKGIMTLRSLSDHFRMDVNGSAQVRSPNGLLMIQHGTAPRSPFNDDVFPAQLTIMLTYVPRDAINQAEALQVLFFHPPQEQQEWHISPSIRTFNVVPKHAEIFTRVRMNDVQGIHSLFDARKASPRDVDEFGFSLLSYIQQGGEDVLELLLRGGANAQNVNFNGSPDDVVSRTWGNFLHNENWQHLRPNLNECIRMSNIALAQGCDVSGNESVRCFNQVPNPLFSMSDSYLNCSDTKTAREAVDALLNMGFDAEERNYRGLTPLLFTASMCTPIAVKSLKALVRRNVNLKTTDPQGKGALHFALGAPDGVDGWPNFVLEDDGRWYGYYLCRQRSCRLRNCIDWLSLYCTICIVHGREFDTEHHDSEPLENPISVALRPADTPWSKKCVEDLTKDELEDWVSSIEDDDSPALTVDDDHSSGAANHSFTDGHGIYELEDWDPDSPARTADDDHSSEVANHIWDPDNTSGHRYWRFIRRHIIPMLKRRMRFKVLTLLQAGCDPNHLDNNGESPSAFAQREGILPEWTCALQESGYVYDKVSDLWKRTTVFA